MIRLYTESDKENWDTYVKSSSESTCYHLSGWKAVIEQTFHHRAYFLLSEGKCGGINGLLPLVHLKSLFFGSYMVSMPYFNYGGVCAQEEETQKQLLQAAVDLAGAKKAKHIEFRHVFPLNPGLPVKTTKVSMQLELPDNSEQLWARFPSKLRNQIKKPINEGFRVRVGREEESASFYKVFSTNMRDLGTPVYPLGFFNKILMEFPDNTRICSVYDQKGEPLASGFLIGFKDCLEMPWASSLRKYNRSSPNMLLYWKVLKFACDQGFKVFDFGRSTIGEGTYKFKEQWGAKPVNLYWHYWLSNGSRLPELNPHNPKYQTAIQAWKKMPVSLTRLIGPRIVKNLP
jgi:serine/alanine adding enzyme